VIDHPGGGGTSDGAAQYDDQQLTIFTSASEGSDRDDLSIYDPDRDQRQELPGVESRPFALLRPMKAHDVKADREKRRLGTTKRSGDAIKASGTRLLAALARRRETAKAQAAMPRAEGIVSERSSAAHDVEVAQEKFTEASADWLAAEVPNPFPAADSLDSQAQSFIEIRVAGGLDAVSGQLQAAVTSGLKMTATGIGLNPAEATISAGICSNLVLAPITGPLGNAATFIEAAGVVIGLATGAHPGTRQSRSCGLKQLQRPLRVAGVVAVGGGDVDVAVQAQQADGQAAQ
jgi:hypothetical protein